METIVDVRRRVRLIAIRAEVHYKTPQPCAPACQVCSDLAAETRAILVEHGARAVTL
mgnify:CR=1 FL=1